MDAAEAKRMSVGGDDMATSETISGKSERAPADGTRIFPINRPVRNAARETFTWPLLRTRK